MHNFEKTVHKLGEQMYLIKDKDKLPFKMSVKESTRATYSQNNRANFFEGQSLKYTTDTTHTEIKLGDYIERGCDNSLPYFVASTIPEPYSKASLIYIYLMRCNSKIDIRRVGEAVDPTDPTQVIKVKTDIATNQWINRDITTRSMKSTDGGLIDQTIHIIYIPRTIGTKIGDFIKIRDDTVLRVDSINDTLVNPDLLTGVDILQCIFYDAKWESIGV
jgi:hypothetical protein